jgi:transcriptional repressor NrdR
VQCPVCSYLDSRVTDSRTVDGAIRRRRECLRCNGRFTTYERVQPAGVLVVKKDGRREEFSRDKLLTGVRKACEKRPLEAGAIESLVDGVEATVVRIGQPEVPSAVIGELVMRGLRTLDQIAYVRFACVYRDFADIDSLREALDDLQSSTRRNAPSREQLTLLPEEELQQLMEPPLIVPLRRGVGRQPGVPRRSQAQ